MGDFYQTPEGGPQYLPREDEIVDVVSVTRVRAATTTALAANTRTDNVLEADANGALGTIDGVADLAVGELLLVQDEATGANNGVYLIESIGGAAAKWSLRRAPGWDSDGRIAGMQIVGVSEGTANGNQLFALTTNDAIVLNTTALVFGAAIASAVGAGAIDTANLAADAVDGTKLADDAVDSEHIAAAAIDPEHYAIGSLAANEVSDHEDATPLALLTAPTGVTLAFVCHVVCTEAVVDGGGGAPTFSAGDGTTPDVYAAAATYTASDSEGDSFIFSGELAPGAVLTITNTDGTGGDAGKYRHCVIASRIAAA